MFKKKIMSKMRVDYGILFLVLVLMFFVTVSDAGAKTSKPIGLKFGIFITEKQPSGPPAIKACRMLENASKGKVKIDIYWAEALGKAPQQLDMVRDGLADIAWY